MGTGSFDSIDQAIGLMRVAAQSMRSVTTPPTQELKAIHSAVNALQAREADLLAVVDETRAHEADGAASVATWAQRELLQDPKTTRQLVQSARTMRDLPQFGAAHRAGIVSEAHVNAMTYGLKHVGFDDTVNLEDEFLTVATQKTPHELFEVLRTCKAIKHSDDLDEAWLRGMDKQDFQCTPVGDGYHVKGFLPVDVGAKLRTYLDAKAAPTGTDDTRSPSERRVDAIDELVTDNLNSDHLPTKNSVSPHLSVIVQAETLKDTLNRATSRSAQPAPLATEPAILEGFGPVGPALLAYITFGAELTPIMVAGFEENQKVLDVGRTERIATKRQRRAIHYRQNGRCANRGCHHPIGEVHHIVDWFSGGETKLTNLVGLCRKCHALITMGRLHMTGTFETGYTFTTSRAGPLARAG